MDLKIKSLTGADSFLKAEAVEGLRSSLRGQLIDASSESYSQARTIWNALNDYRRSKTNTTPLISSA